MQAEALLRLHKHEEAYRSYRRAPSFSVESCAKCVGSAGTSYLLIIGAQVYMAAGRLVKTILFSMVICSVIFRCEIFFPCVIIRKLLLFILLLTHNHHRIMIKIMIFRWIGLKTL